MASDQPQTPHESLGLGYAEWETETGALIYIFGTNSRKIQFKPS